MKYIGSQVEEFRNVIRKPSARYGVELTAAAVERLCAYFELVSAWNPRLHLVAPCSPQEFATRHVLESLLLLSHLTANAHVADVGSGAGLPIIPVLIARPDIHATMIESSQKKSVFLREALRTLGVSARANVFADRFENLPSPQTDYVTCRALDRFSDLFSRVVAWTPKASTLLLFGGEALGKQIESAGLKCQSHLIPGSERSWLFVISRN